VLAKGDAFSSRDRDSRHLGADSTAKILLCEYGIRGHRAFSFHWKDLLIHSAHLMLVEHIFFTASNPILAKRKRTDKLSTMTSDQIDSPASAVAAANRFMKATQFSGRIF